GIHVCRIFARSCQPLGCRRLGHGEPDEANVRGNARATKDGSVGSASCSTAMDVQSKRGARVESSLLLGRFYVAGRLEMNGSTRWRKLGCRNSISKVWPSCSGD